MVDYKGEEEEKYDSPIVNNKIMRKINFKMRIAVKNFDICMNKLFIYV